MNDKIIEHQDNAMNDRTVKIGLIGTGKRGMKLLAYLLSVRGVEVVAVCDRVVNEADQAARFCTDSGVKTPSVYGGEKDFVSLMLFRKFIQSHQLPWG